MTIPKSKKIAKLPKKLTIPKSKKIVKPLSDSEKSKTPIKKKVTIPKSKKIAREGYVINPETGREVKISDVSSSKYMQLVRAGKIQSSWIPRKRSPTSPLIIGRPLVKPPKIPPKKKSPTPKKKSPTPKKKSPTPKKKSPPRWPVPLFNVDHPEEGIQAHRQKFWKAVRSGDIEQVFKLLARSDVRERNKGLSIATELGYTEIADLLYRAGGRIGTVEGNQKPMDDERSEPRLNIRKSDGETIIEVKKSDGKLVKIPDSKTFDFEMDDAE